MLGSAHFGKLSFKQVGSEGESRGLLLGLESIIRGATHCHKSGVQSMGRGLVV